MMWVGQLFTKKTASGVNDPPNFVETSGVPPLFEYEMGRIVVGYPSIVWIVVVVVCDALHGVAFT